MLSPSSLLKPSGLRARQQTFGPAIRVPSGPSTTQPSRTRDLCTSVSASNNGGGFGALLKKIQGSLPIVGLVSRLATPEGGFDELAYPEYCRGMFEKGPRGMTVALQEWEAKYGKVAASRWVLLMCWMVDNGLGLVTGKEIVSAARRLRVTQDIEVEIDRFDLAKTATRKKYDMMAPPTAKAAEKAVVIIDALCVLCLGLKDGEAAPADDAPRLAEIVLAALPELSREAVDASIAGRPQRAGAYA